MSVRCSSHPFWRTGVRVLFAFALTAASQSVDDAAAAQKLVKFDETGSAVLVPNSDSPKGCLKTAKTACSGKFIGTATSTLFPGVSQLSGIFSVDFKKPEFSAIGVCFPELVTGSEHTSRGDLKYVSQGRICIPPASAGLSPGFAVELRAGLFTGETGAFAHLFGTGTVNGSSSPSGSIFRSSGVVARVEGVGK